jgi:LacI family transcriptional regulator
MPSDDHPPVTLSSIARRTGLSLAAVSYALRNSPKIPAATRAAVLRAARELGYRPNPRVASLMAHIRGGRAGAVRECLAFVWVHTTRRESRQSSFLRSVLAGARRRATQLGFGIEEFWTADPGMTDRRLEGILRARGIVGVILSPVMTAESAVTLDWDWSLFAAAVIGNVTWTPELHHAGHHHFLGMRLALRELAQGGLVRPAAVIEHGASERSKHAWEAAFLTHHPDARAARRLIRIAGPGEAAATARWLRRTGADALLVSDGVLQDDPTLLPASRRLGLDVFTLRWDRSLAGEIGGVDQCYDRIAGHAVDLVATQLNVNETGVPDLPCLMLFPGRWIAPAGEAAGRRARSGAR